MPRLSRPLLANRLYVGLVASLSLVSLARTSIASPPEPNGGRQHLDGRSAAVIEAAQREMTINHLRSVILRVTLDGREVVTTAMGTSDGNSPATTNMHFRNGAVAISYIATLLLQLVDEQAVTLDAPLSRWLPELPDSGQVTLRMLANMTAGYPDYVRNVEFLKQNAADVHRQWTPAELIDLGLSTPRTFPPGTNWDYSHTDYLILGRALERIAGMPMAALMQTRIFEPLHLANTRSVASPAIQEPVLHAFTSERRETLGIPATERFYEDSTYWNPSWTLAEGAIQTTDIKDMAATAEVIGTGSLLSAASHATQVAPSLIGFGHEQPGCPNCHRLDKLYSYGIGVVIVGEWILQNPLFSGYASMEAYLPARKLAVAVSVTFGQEAFDDRGEYRNSRVAKAIVSDISAIMTGDPLPH